MKKRDLADWRYASNWRDLGHNFHFKKLLTTMKYNFMETKKDN